MSARVIRGEGATAPAGANVPSAPSAPFAASAFRVSAEQLRGRVAVERAADWLAQLGLRVPEDVGLLVHDWTQRMKGCAGIHQRRDHVASAAVDLVATQLMQNERGVPEVPHQILIPPSWVEGASIRALPKTTSSRARAAQAAGTL